MISVKNLSKTYFKGKSNEIKVINNTTLELPSTGLVSFLGHSGSGKTTLLNTIGGLDKANSGSISYDDLTINRYNMHKVDKYRRDNVGYVFQNYLLLEQYSVYENLRMALELINITDKAEVDKRIEYALKAVGLYSFRKKLAGNLSGGQQQRVSIARCLVKKSKIIIADEPTGNLDSENTIEVMNILKKISKESLVLLVTHSREVALFYSDKIVELKDGRVEAYKDNESTGTLDSTSEKKIHLLDYNKEEINSDNLNVTLYKDSESSAQNITIVIKNNVIYIDGVSRLQLVKDNNIELVEDHYKSLEQSMINDFNYDTSWFNETRSNNVLKNFFIGIGHAFRDFYTDPKRRKLFNMIFVLIGMVSAILCIIIGQTTYLNTSSISTEPGVKMLYNKDNIEDGYDYSSKKTEVIEAIEKGYITDVYVDQENSSIAYIKNSVENTRIYLLNEKYPYSRVASYGLLVGAEPKGDQVVLGKDTADNIIEKLGKNYTYNDLVGLTIGNNVIAGVSNAKTNSIYTVSDAAQYGYYTTYVDYDYKDRVRAALTGDYSDCYVGDKPTKEDEVSIYYDVYYNYNINIGDTLTFNNKTYKVTSFHNVDVDIITNDKGLLSTKIANGTIVDNDLNKYSDFSITYMSRLDYSIVEGKAPTSMYEVLVPASFSYNIGDTITVSNIELNITGKYYTKEKRFTNGYLTYNALLTNDKTMNVYKANAKNYISVKYDIVDSDEATAFFDSKNLTIVNVYDYEVAVAQARVNSTNQVLVIIEFVLLGIILVYTYFSFRAKMISDIYDIGVLRSLGAKRSKLIGKNLLESFAKSTLTTLLGYVLVFIAYAIVATKFNKVLGSTYLPINYSLGFLGILILYASQLFIGALPLILLLRKTPAEINSKYDV